MSEPLLNVMKIMLLASLYLFFVRVLWSVYNELRDPRTRLQRRPEPVPPVGPSADEVRGTLRRPLATMPAGAPSGGSAPQPAVAVASPVVVGQLTALEPAELTATFEVWFEFKEEARRSEFLHSL